MSNLDLLSKAGQVSLYIYYSYIRFYLVYHKLLDQFPSALHHLHSILTL